MPSPFQSESVSVLGVRPMSFRRLIPPLALASLTLLASGCREGNADEPLPFEGVDISGIDAPWIEPDWSGIEVVRASGAGYPDLPLLPIREEARIDIEPYLTAMSTTELGGLLVEGDGSIYLDLRSYGRSGPNNRTLTVLSPDGTYIETIELGEGLRGPREPLIAIRDGVLHFGYGAYPTGELHTSSTFDLQTRSFDLFSTGAVGLEALTEEGGFFTRWETGLETITGEVRSRARRTRIFWIPSTAPGEAIPIADVPLGDYICRSVGGDCAGTMPFLTPMGDHGFDGLGQAYVHSGFPYRIDVYDRYGRPVRRIERDHTPVSPLFVLAQRATGMSDQSIEWYLAKPSVSDAVAALGEMLVSPSGTILVHRPDLEDFPGLVRDAQVFWDLFSPDGSFRGTIELPERFTPQVVTDRGVYGIEGSGRRKSIIQFSWD